MCRPLGRGQHGIDQTVLRGEILFHHNVDETRPLCDGLEDELVVAFGLGSYGSFHDHFQGLAEPEITALEEIILEALPGLVHIRLQMSFVTLQGRGAQAVLLAEGG